MNPSIQPESASVRNGEVDESPMSDSWSSPPWNPVVPNDGGRVVHRLHQGKESELTEFTPASPKPAGLASKAGVVGGLVASIPFVGPAFATLCASCLGVGLAGTAAAAATLDSAGPIAYAVAGVSAAGGLGWSLRRCRHNCSVEQYRRARILYPLFVVGAGLVSYVVGAAILPPLFVAIARQLQGVLP